MDKNQRTPHLKIYLFFVASNFSFHGLTLSNNFQSSFPLSEDKNVSGELYTDDYVFLFSLTLSYSETFLSF